MLKPHIIDSILPSDSQRNRAPVLMGIVNVTPDSFSDGGAFLDPEAALDHALKLIDEGAGIIDIGGESSRPGSEPVAAKVELSRVIPVITSLKKEISIPISVDTTKADVAERAIEAGASMVNDISALRFDPRMAEVISAHGVAVVLMHMLGSPRTMQVRPVYKDVVREVGAFFEERLEFCSRRGIENVLIDPGIGFGKRLEDNVNLLRHLESFRRFGVPIVVGSSRKSFLGILTDRDVSERLAGTIASNIIAWMHGASVLRVHDVAAARDALIVAQSILAGDEVTV